MIHTNTFIVTLVLRCTIKSHLKNDSGKMNDRVGKISKTEETPNKG